MTTLRQIITDAYRESGVIQIGTVPEAEELSEGLRKLKTLISNLFGNELGIPFASVAYGTPASANTYSRELDLSSLINSTYIPVNARVLVNLTSDTTLYFPPDPHDGARVGIIDVPSNFATNELTLNGNGRKIAGTATVTLNTNGDNREWFYRADQANWIELTTLTENSESPFPSEFDDYLVVMLAIRLNPRFMVETSVETREAFEVNRRKFRARYKSSGTARLEEGILRFSGPGNWSSYYSTPDSFWEGL